MTLREAFGPVLAGMQLAVVLGDPDLAMLLVYLLLSLG